LGGAAPADVDHGFFKTGFPFIDRVVSEEGLFPRGGIVELMGLKSTCKTTLALHAIGEAMRANKDLVVWWDDYESQLQGMADYAKALGVDITSPNFIHNTPITLQEGGNAMEKAVLTGGVDIFVVDSTASMRPAQEMDNDLGDTKQAGLRGKLISELLRNITANLNQVIKQGDKPPAIIFINQLYQRLDIKNPNLPPMYDSPASNALKFFASARVELKVKGFEKRKVLNPFTLEKEDTRVATLIEAMAEKNKVGVPFQKAYFCVRYGEGVDPIMSFMKAAMVARVIRNKGNSSRMEYAIDGNVSDSHASMLHLHDFLRDNHDIVIKLSEQDPALSVWTKCLKNKLPMVSYARKVMANTAAGAVQNLAADEEADIEEL
jgi:protein RecA